MTEQAAETVPTETRKAHLKRLLASARKKAEIRGLQVMEQWVRRKGARLLCVQALGGFVAFHGVYLYSHRIAFILLGVGVLVAAERQ